MTSHIHLQRLPFERNIYVRSFRILRSVWIVEGPTVRDMGVLFTTRMTVVKVCNGSLWNVTSS